MKKPNAYLSASQINTFLYCPLSYKYGYLDGGIKEPPNIYMIYGTVMHGVLEYNYSQKMHSKKDCPVEDLIKLFIERFNMSAKGINFQNDTMRRSLQLSAEATLNYYMKNIAPGIQPKFVEYEFKIPLKNFPITIMGYIDLITEDDFIHDYKTVGKDWKRKYSSSNISSDIQTTLYAAAFRKAFKHQEKGVVFDIMPRSEGKVYELLTERTEEQILEVLQMATNIEKIIELGVLIPALSNCPTCPYKNTCNKQIYIDKKTLQS